MKKAQYIKTTTIHIKIDERVKEEVQFIVDEMGLTVSGVINAFLRQLIRTREINFTAKNKMTPYFEKIIKESRSDVNRYKFRAMPLEDVFD